MSIGNKLCIGTFIILLLFIGLCGLIGFFTGPLAYDIITAIINSRAGIPNGQNTSRAGMEAYKAKHEKYFHLWGTFSFGRCNRVSRVWRFQLPAQGL